MAKIKKKDLDSVSPAPVRQASYEAPEIKNMGKRSVPREYQTLERAPKGRGGFLWFLFLLFLAAIGGFVYWTQRNNTQVDNSLDFSVSGPTEIVSGDQATFVVKYKNNDVVTLQQLELSVRWPKGFYFDESSVAPSDTNATTWFLADLAPGQEAQVEIKGLLVGQKDEALSSFFTLGYQPENFHSDFKVKQTIDTKVTDNKLELSIEAVDKTMVSTDQEMKINFHNLTSEPLTNLYLDVLYPEDFVLATSTSAETTDFVKDESGQYLILNLDPDQTKSLTVKGSFSADSKSQESLVVEVGNMTDSKFRRLSRVEKEFLIINPNFDIKLEVNGNNTDQAVNWGDVLRYKLDITNNSGTDITDAKIIALLDSPALDWNSLETVASHDGNSLTWTKQQSEDLAKWANGESRTLTWQIKVADKPQAERMIENIVKINIEGLAGWEQVSSPLTLTIGETLSFTNGIYWELGGRRVGSGLLPPQVGETTDYLVVWALTQATGDFETVTIESSLPPGVSFVSETDVQEGTLDFSSDSKNLKWIISSFDKSILPTTASFVIRVEPSDKDRGQAMTLLNSTTVTAKNLEEVIVRSKLLKTSDVVSSSDEPIGIVK